MVHILGPLGHTDLRDMEAEAVMCLWDMEVEAITDLRDMEVLAVTFLQDTNHPITATDSWGVTDLLDTASLPGGGALVGTGAAPEATGPAGEAASWQALSRCSRDCCGSAEAAAAPAEVTAAATTADCDVTPLTEAHHRIRPHPHRTDHFTTRKDIHTQKQKLAATIWVAYQTVTKALTGPCAAMSRAPAPSAAGVN